MPRYPAIRHCHQQVTIGQACFRLLVQEFDDEELADAITQGNVEEDTPVAVNSDGQLEPVDEDSPLQSDLRALADYQTVDEPSLHEDEAAGINDPEEDEVDMIVVSSHSTTAPGLAPQQTDCFAGSEPLEQIRNNHDLPPFVHALGLYYIKYGISRAQYSALQDVMNLLKTSDDGLAQLDRLPPTVDTLKRHVHEERPHIEIRRKTVALQPDKLPSSRITNALVSGNDANSQELYYINPVSLMQRLLQSSLASSMHFGLAHLVDTPTEAWHSIQWAGSIRTTSGEFAKYPNGEPIFPGDIVKFGCGVSICKVCRSDNPQHHTGQVMEVYRDQRNSTRRLGPTTLSASSPVAVDSIEKGSIVLAVARIQHAADVLNHDKKKNVTVKVGAFQEKDITPGELIMIADPPEYVDPRKVVGPATGVSIDFSWGSKVSLDEDPDPNMIRRVFHLQDACFLVACKVSPVPGYLEVNQFGRQELVSQFCRAKGKKISAPLLNFNNSFDLYRTIRKSIMGCYL